MAHRADDLQREIEDTQRDIDDTRSAMTEKLEMLEERVRETVEDAHASVEDIVENVKDTVGDTVATVKRTFDLHYQVGQHPWLMFGGATLVGYLLGSRGGSSTSAAVFAHDPRLSPAGTTAASSSESSARPQPQQGIVSGVRDRFKDEIALIEGAVIGAVISTLGDMVKQALLPPAPPITSARTKLSGQPSESPAQSPVSRPSTGVNRSAIL